MQIGFVGVGMMGHGMALNLLNGEHAVHVIAHRARANVEDLVGRGAREVSDLAELARASELVILCVSNSDAVEEAVAGLEPGLKPGAIVLDMGTSKPASNVALAERLKEFGVRFAEAPLAGGPEQAAAGELGAMVGADEETLEAIRPALRCMCARISHFGPVGAGATAKLISNYLVMGMIALICDTYNVARTAGIDWAKLFDVMQCGSNNSGALRKIVAPALEGDFDGYKFSLQNALKDISYYLQMADEHQAVSPLAQEIGAVFRRAMDDRLGEQMVSRLIDPAIARTRSL